MSRINTEDAKTAGYFAFGAFIIFAGYKALQFINVVPDKEDKEANKFSKLLSKFTSPAFPEEIVKIHKQNTGNKLVFSKITEAQGKKYNATALKIYEVKGFFKDDEDKLYTIFRNLENGLQFWHWNLYFQKKYDVSIIDYIKGFTSVKERAIIYEIIKNIPLYKTK